MGVSWGFASYDERRVGSQTSRATGLVRLVTTDPFSLTESVIVNPFDVKTLNMIKIRIYQRHILAQNVLYCLHRCAWSQIQLRCGMNKQKLLVCITPQAVAIYFTYLELQIKPELNANHGCKSPKTSRNMKHCAIGASNKVINCHRTPCAELLSSHFLHCFPFDP